MTTFTASVVLPPAPPEFDRPAYSLTLSTVETQVLETVLGRVAEPPKYQQTQGLRSDGSGTAFLRLVDRYLAPINQEVDYADCERWITQMNNAGDAARFADYILPVWQNAGLVIRYSRGLSSPEGRLVFARELPGQTSVPCASVSEATQVLVALEIPDLGLCYRDGTRTVLVGSARADEVELNARRALHGASSNVAIPGWVQRDRAQMRRVMADVKPPDMADQLYQRLTAIHQLAAWAAARDGRVCWA